MRRLEKNLFIYHLCCKSCGISRIIPETLTRHSLSKPYLEITFQYFSAPYWFTNNENISVKEKNFKFKIFENISTKGSCQPHLAWLNYSMFLCDFDCLEMVGEYLFNIFKFRTFFWFRISGQANPYYIKHLNFKCFLLCSAQFDFIGYWKWPKTLRTNLHSLMLSIIK